jgi:undecaprenyl diphosphate synthase
VRSRIGRIEAIFLTLPGSRGKNKYFATKSKLRIRVLCYHEKLPMRALLEALKPGEEDETLARAVDPGRLPAHIAIIMDGNGRWAKRRGLPRVAGHTAGMRSVRGAIETCSQLGIRALTLYAFSIENWKRPRAEVEMLWRLLRTYLRSELPELIGKGIRLNVIGRVDALPPQVRSDLEEALAKTSANRGLLVNLAINYGGRAEIVDAVKALVEDAKRGDVIIDEAAIAARLYTAGIADPDLLIRTSGEMRVSNFLLWQIAYAELYVTDTLWPDFTRADLLRAVLDYQKRDRRFGGLGTHAPSDASRPSDTSTSLVGSLGFPAR